MKKITLLQVFLLILLSLSSCSSSEDDVQSENIPSELIGEYRQTKSVENGEYGGDEYLLELDEYEGLFLEFYGNGNFNWGDFDENNEKVVFDSDIDYQNKWTYLGKRTLELANGNEIETHHIKTNLGGGIWEMDIMKVDNEYIMFHYVENEGYEPYLDFDSAFGGYYRKTN